MLKGVEALLQREDISGKIAHDGAGRHIDEGRNSVAVLESVLDMQDFVVEFTDLLLQNLVVVFQPVFADIVDGALVDMFQLQLQLK
jgi:hypothetical protein